MKKINILLSVIAAMAAVSCVEKEPQMTIGEPVEMTFEASAKTITKTQLTDGNKVIWCESDKISVFDGQANNQFGIIGFKENSGTATFQGLVAADATYYAAYPYNTANAMAGNTISLQLPATQTATAGTFADGYALAVAKAVDGSLAFSNVTSLVKVTLAEDVTDIKSISLKGNNGEAIAGSISVTLGSEGAIESIAAAGNTEVSLSGALEAGKSYYFTIAGDVSFSKGLTFTITLSNDKNVEISSETPVTIGKGTIVPLFTSLSSDRWTPVLTFGEENSFDYAASQTFKGERIASASLVYAPEGWTVNTDDAPAGIVITAPAQTVVAEENSAVVPKGNVVLTLTADNGTSAEVSVPVRLNGINDDTELHDFLDAYGRKNGAAKGDISKYCSDGWIVLNSDLNAPQEEFTSEAFLAYNHYTPLDGNNKTITATCQGANGVVCLFQNLNADVKNLNIAGSMTCTRSYNAQVRLGSLAASLYTSGITIENVHSSVEITFSPSGVTDRNSTTNAKHYIGGLVGNSANDLSILFKNCSYSGTMNINYKVMAAGGIMGSTAQGAYPTEAGYIRDDYAESTFSGCRFSGNIIYKPIAKQIKKEETINNAEYNRLGGIVGDASRFVVIDENTQSSGTISIDMANDTQSEYFDGGAGGIVGWKSDVAILDILNSTNSTIITLTNLHPSANAPVPTKWFDPIVGQSPIKNQGALSCSGVTNTGKVVYSYYQDGAAAGEITTSKHQLN